MNKTLKFLHFIIYKLRPAPLASFIKKIFFIRRRNLQSESGIFFADPVSHFAQNLYLKEGYEPELRKCLEAELVPGMTFVDIGANEGFFSVVAANKIKPNGRLIAVEPQSRLHGVIAKNLELNQLLENAIVMRCALSDTVCTSKINLAPDVNTGASGLQNPFRYRVKTEICPVLTLSKLLESFNLEKVDLMKIDIEGFEYEAILGSKDVFLSHKVSKIALELHPWLLKKRGKDTTEITSFLESCGYHLNTNYSNTLYEVK